MNTTNPKLTAAESETSVLADLAQDLAANRVAKIQWAGLTPISRR